jgi:hypothetical protein
VQDEGRDTATGGTHEPNDDGAAEPTDHALGRSRGGYGSKLHLACDANGITGAFAVTAWRDGREIKCRLLHPRHPVTREPCGCAARREEEEREARRDGAGRREREGGRDGGATDQECAR